MRGFIMSYMDKNTSNDFYDPIWIYVLIIKEQQRILEKQAETLATLLSV